MNYEVFYEGVSYTIEISEDVSRFLNKSDPITIGLIAILERLADVGKINNKEHFRCEGDGIFAVKKKHMRLYGFFSKRKNKFFVACHPAIKKKKKANPRDLKRAKKLRDEYEAGGNDG